MLEVRIAGGSRAEDRLTSGATHLAEHLLLHSAHASTILREFDRHGAEVRGVTAREYLSIRVSSATRLPARTGELLAELIGGASFDTSDFEREQAIVLEELALREERTDVRLLDSVAKKVYGDHPLGLPVGGTTASIAELDPARVENVQRGLFDRSRFALAATGHDVGDALEGFASRLVECVQAAGPWRFDGRTPPLRFAWADATALPAALGVLLAAGGAVPTPQPETASLLDEVNRRFVARCADRSDLRVVRSLTGTDRYVGTTMWSVAAHCEVDDVADGRRTVATLLSGAIEEAKDNADPHLDDGRAARPAMVEAWASWQNVALDRSSRSTSVSTVRRALQALIDEASEPLTEPS